MIQFATNEMVSDLKLIWKECFHDEDAYIDFYYENRFLEENTVVWLERERPVSMLTLLPATLHDRAGMKEVYYIYAVATLPQYRSKGISSNLLQHANRITNGMTILVPATESLYRFYERNGYHKNFDRRVIRQVVEVEGDRIGKVELPPGEAMLKISEYTDDDANGKGSSMVIQDMMPNDAARYKRIRDHAFKGEGYIEWDETAIIYSMKENAFTGGFTHLIDGKYIVMCRPFEETLYIRETNLPEDRLADYAKMMARKLGCRSIEIYLQSSSEIPGINEQFAMCSERIRYQHAYFNLVLD